jgi:hypothetical protein
MAGAGAYPNRCSGPNMHPETMPHGMRRGIVKINPIGVLDFFCFDVNEVYKSYAICV